MKREHRSYVVSFSFFMNYAIVNWEEIIFPFFLFKNLERIEVYICLFSSFFLQKKLSKNVGKFSNDLIILYHFIYY